MKLVPAAEAAYCLRRQLGALQCWEDLLADFRRGKRDAFHGACLLPWGVLQGAPMYRACDINDFVVRVRSIKLHAAPARLKIVEVMPLEPGWELMPWRTRKLHRVIPSL